MTKDFNGVTLRVGDIVIIHPTFSSKGPLRFNEYHCSILSGYEYKVTDIYAYNRISIVHEPTGLRNCWLASYFIKVNKKQSHVISWL